MDGRDIRIECFRDLSRYWSAQCRATHLPTGLVVEFEETWKDRSGRKHALEELEAKVNSVR